MKILEYNAALILRRNGLTYAEIQQRLGVSKGSLSRWLQSIPYQPTSETLACRRTASINAGRVLHQRKIERVKRIQEQARQTLPRITPDALHLLGIMAYWAEGSKTQDDQVAFTNTDLALICLVQRWWIEFCKADPRRLRLHIRVHQNTAKNEAEKYWRAVTGIPVEQCHKTTIKESGSGGRRIRKIRYGIATIKICDTELHYRIQAWIGGIMNHLNGGLAAPVAQLDRAAGF